ncbi:MAG: hypothetical protein V8R54_02330 [Coprococcus sp.]|jgi:hypothetical protein|uniref:hypothetical protein n=1 Tax=Clostridia TaxID=186801 RepID=UPI00015BCBC5|nr:hypothetical protein [Clostridium sp. L2-50]EDO59082.1 hypothetical protein CLOL250_00140 [Clostridium sp. L2-50]UEA75508.1 hypothetical protein LK416_04825 [Lachnospiraceae bacterium GAM79]UEA76243.1 hypothetical protein LK424_08175 [Lachnospiraceae bacterium GAM79]
MEKGQYGYIKKHKKKIITSIIILGVMILTGVILSLVMFKTTKTLIIILPILISLPFAKQIVALIMCSKFKPLTEEEHKKIEKGIHYENRDGILYDISISRYEGMMFFPAVIVRDGRMLFLYQKAFDKKIPDVEFLKKEIARSFEMIKKPYVIITALTVDEFIKKAEAIKEPDEDYVVKDQSMREKIFELGV